jgi:glycosyltransferase involved in cell wall biosynthesis
LVVGDGPERRRLESAAGEGIVFLGNRLDVPEILRSLDVFVLPSLNEGISNTILEAMASGVPVVATRVGGNPELVEDGQTGTLVSARDKEAFASALIRYLDDPDLRRLHGEAGRARACNHFSVSKMVDGYEAVYRRVAESSRNKRLDRVTPVK